MLNKRAQFTEHSPYVPKQRPKLEPAAILHQLLNQIRPVNQDFWHLAEIWTSLLFLLARSDMIFFSCLVQFCLCLPSFWRLV